MSYKIEITASSAEELGKKVSDLYAIYGTTQNTKEVAALVEALPAAAPQPKAPTRVGKKPAKPVVEKPKAPEPEEEDFEDAIEDMDDLTDEEDAEDDIETIEEEELTVDDLRAVMQQYINLHGMDNTRKDGLNLLADALGAPPAGKEFWTVTLIGESSPEVLNKAIFAWDKAVKAGTRYGH